MQVRTDGTLLAGMDSGYPLAAVAGTRDYITWQGQKTLASNLSFTNLQLYLSTRASAGAYLTIPRTSLVPSVPSSIGVGTTVIVQWTMKVDFSQIASIIHGSGSKSSSDSKIASSKVGLLNRIIGSESGSTAGKVQVFQTTSPVNLSDIPGLTNLLLNATKVADRSITFQPRYSFSPVSPSHFVMVLSCYYCESLS